MIKWSCFLLFGLMGEKKSVRWSEVKWELKWKEGTHDLLLLQFFVISLLFGPCPATGTRDYIALDPTFESLYLIRTDFFDRSVYRLFRLEQIFFGVQSVDTVDRWTNILSIYLSIGKALFYIHFELNNSSWSNECTMGPPAPPWRMDGKWWGNSFLLGFSSLANHGG